MSSCKQDQGGNSKSIEAKKEPTTLSDNHSLQSIQTTRIANHFLNATSNPLSIPLTFNQSRTQSKKTAIGDRFIPQRQKPKEDQLNYFLLQQGCKDRFNSKNHLKEMNDFSENHNALNTMILDALSYNGDALSVDVNSIRKMRENKGRLLSFNSKPSINKGKGYCCGFQNNLLNQVSMIIENKTFSEQLKNSEAPLSRRIPSTPYKVLDAPKLIDDFYLNLIDWGSRNVIAVCLEAYVYLWNFDTMKTVTLCAEKENICSVKWMENGTCLAVGLNDGSCDLYDAEKMAFIRKMNGHSSRVCCLDWSNYFLSSGGKDSQIIHHDVRASEHITSVIESRSKEVCSLKWSLDGKLLASGGNDSSVSIWDINNAHTPYDIFHMSIDNDDSINPPKVDITPVFRWNYHRAAVKALAWCPYQRHVLASGGGAKDNSIKLWNCDSGLLIKSTDTGSQLCSLLWNPMEKELISSHGYTKNQIAFWSYSKMTKLCELTGHKNRVLYLSLSPDACSLVSGSGDESLRFWSINDAREADNDAIDTANDMFLSRQASLNAMNLR